TEPKMDHQRFVLILIVSLVGTSFGAQIFSTEDRDSILKFMNVFMNFLDMETDNSTLTSTTLSPNGTTLSSNGTSLETTTLPSGNSTVVTTESSVTSSNSIATTSNSTASADPSSSTTVSGNSTTVTTEATTTTVRRRICFKRYCYKFSNDKGYIV
ncbi:hypothetical protein KR074_011284, partial [Drosophila pseudoananassae]